MLIFSTSVRLLKMIQGFIHIYRKLSAVNRANLWCRTTLMGYSRENWTRTIEERWWTSFRIPRRIFSSCLLALWQAVWG